MTSHPHKSINNQITLTEVHNVLSYFENYALSAKSILPCTLIIYGVYERIFGGEHRQLASFMQIL